MLTAYSRGSPLPGLFQRAIMQSGTTLCPWMVREGHKQVATKMSEIFNCSAVDENSSSSLDSAALVACLRDVPLDKLIVETLVIMICCWRWSERKIPKRREGNFLVDSS